MDNIVVAPILIPLFTAIACIFAWTRVLIQRYIVFAGTVLLMVSIAVLGYSVFKHGIISLQAGNWPAPFGISIVADEFSILMVAAASVLLFCILIFALDEMPYYHKAFGFYPIVFVLMTGINGALLTGDIFNLYVWFEVMLMASFILIAYGGKRSQLEGAVKYVTINVLASGLLLGGIGIVYSGMGTLNMADLAVKIPMSENLVQLEIAAAFFLISFGIKSAVFPLFFWLPASYHTPPMTIAALIAGLLTKVGVYVIIRFFTLLFPPDLFSNSQWWMVISGFTMVIGVFGAMAQNDIRKILSFHIVSQIGYMIMGLAIYTPMAIAGAIYFILHNIIVKSNLFLISGVVGYIKKDFLLKRIGGIYDNFPILSVLFVISAFSLAGIPPLSGFWGKLFLIQAGFSAGEFLIIGISLFVSVFTLFSMTKIWLEVFLSKQTSEPKSGSVIKESDLFRKGRWMFISVIIMTLVIVVFSLRTDWIFEWCIIASENLMNKQNYINAVLK